MLLYIALKNRQVETRNVYLDLEKTKSHEDTHTHTHTHTTAKLECHSTLGVKVPH